jgi:hypothetical protein
MSPICKGKLFDDFGYTASTPASKAVLDGTYVAPTYSDKATMKLFAEISAISKLIPKNSVFAVITPTQWRQNWQIVNKETSSSESGLLFGHYIIGGKSDLITHYHATRVSVTLAHSIQLERWSRGLSVMLEKTLGVMLVTKLRAILLLHHLSTNFIPPQFHFVFNNLFETVNRSGVDEPIIDSICQDLFCLNMELCRRRTE